MATYQPAKKNTAWIGYISLVSQASTLVMKSNPTLASGDFKVSIDGGALANLATLPTVTPASSVMVKISLSSSEMNGDNITVVCSDAAGAEWCDLVFNIQTAARQIDDLAYPETRGRSIVVDANGLVDANTVKIGPTGSGTAQTAKDVGGAVPAAAAGASGGLLISGSNSGTTTLGALTVTGATTHTGNVVLSDGLTISAPSTLNRAGLAITGNGTGQAVIATGGATGAALKLVGGGTSGECIIGTTTSGDGVSITATGTSKHGMVITGGNGGTSDGVKMVAGTGGVDLRAAITGNGTGNLSGSVGSVTGAVGSVTGNVGGNVTGSVGSVTGAVGSVTGNVGGNVTGSIGSVVGAVGSVTGNVGGNVVGSVASVTAAVAVTSNIKTNQALANFEFMMTDSTNHAPATGKTVTCTRSIDGAAFAAGTLANVAEVSNGMYRVDFGSGDLNGKVIVLRATAASCDDTFERIVTQP